MARYIDGGSGGNNGTGRGGTGGGSPGTGSGSSSGGTFPATENGGVFAGTYYLLVPMQDASSGRCYIAFYDVTSFDDQLDGSSYSYRVEDVNTLRVPTIRRVGLVYRDLGPATVTVTVKATNDNGQVVSGSTTVTIGNMPPTNALITNLVDVNVVGYRPQITLTRAAYGGPLSIVSVSLIGTVEDTAL